MSVLQADAAAFAVTAVPTFLLFVDGVEKLRLAGFQSVADRTGVIDKVLEGP
jgi:thiol-disulfide isomerase/thioredoxin